MKMTGSREPLPTYTIPPHAPPAVAEAYDRFDRVADERAAARGELDDLRQAAKVAHQEAHAAAARAAIDGTKAPDPDKVRRDNEIKISALERRIETLRVAVDISGSELCDAIAQHRGEWAPLVEQAEAQAAERFRAAMQEAQAALKDLVPCRRSVEWLADFNPSEARAGAYPQFSGGKLVVEGTAHAPMRGDLNPAELLALAATAADPPKPPRVRSGTKVAAPAAGFAA